MMENIFTVIHILTCLLLILVILLQSGKGGGVSAAFGGGAGAALGQRSAATVLGKVTAIAATVFMVTSMVLAVYSTPGARDRTLNDVEGAATGAAVGETANTGGAAATPEPATPTTPEPSDEPGSPTEEEAESPGSPIDDLDVTPRGVLPDPSRAPASQDTAEDAR